MLSDWAVRLRGVTDNSNVKGTSNRSDHGQQRTLARKKTPKELTKTWSVSE